MRNASNNLLAGVFVLVGVVGFVLIVLTLSGVSAWASSRTPYTVRFTLRDGATGLKQGSLVRVGGQQVGTVKSVAFVNNPDSGAPQFVDVVVGVNASIKLFNDAVVQLELPLLGSVSTINIPAAGTPAAGVLAPGATINGQLAPPAFLAQAGYGNEQRTQVQQMLAGGARLVDDSQKLVADLQREAAPLLRQAAEVATDARQATSDLRARINDWSPRIDRTLANAEQFTADLRTSRAQLDEGITLARDFIQDLRSLVGDNRPRIDAILKNADELVNRANTQLYAQVQATLDDGRAGLKVFAEAGQRASSLIAEAAPELRLTFANARLSSDQLKLLMAEVRRNPWRLLYQPGRKELEQELLYEATRAYALAVSELRGVSAALEAASAASAQLGAHSSTQPGAIDPAGPERLAALRDELQRSFARYRQAEQALFDRLLGSGATPPPPSAP